MCIYISFYQICQYQECGMYSVCMTCSGCIRNLFNDHRNRSFQTHNRYPDALIIYLVLFHYVIRYLFIKHLLHSPSTAVSICTSLRLCMFFIRAIFAHGCLMLCFTTTRQSDQTCISDKKLSTVVHFSTTLSTCI